MSSTHSHQVARDTPTIRLHDTYRHSSLWRQVGAYRLQKPVHEWDTAVDCSDTIPAAHLIQNMNAGA